MCIAPYDKSHGFQVLFDFKTGLTMYISSELSRRYYTGADNVISIPIRNTAI